MNPRIVEMEAEIKRLKDEDAAAAKVLRESVKPEWKFTFTPAPPQEANWDSVRPQSGVRCYVLHGEILNHEAIKAVGGWKDRSGEGSYTYMVNFATPYPTIVAGVGGGVIYISGGAWGREPIKAEPAFMALERFLFDHPEGGDVTEIINAHRNSDQGK